MEESPADLDFHSDPFYLWRWIEVLIEPSKINNSDCQLACARQSRLKLVASTLSCVGDEFIQCRAHSPAEVHTASRFLHVLQCCAPFGVGQYLGTACGPRLVWSYCWQAAAGYYTLRFQPHAQWRNRPDRLWWQTRRQNICEAFRFLRKTRLCDSVHLQGMCKVWFMPLLSLSHHDPESVDILPSSARFMWI